jgi:hypothetical protein
VGDACGLNVHRPAAFYIYPKHYIYIYIYPKHFVYVYYICIYGACIYAYMGHVGVLHYMCHMRRRIHVSYEEEDPCVI